MPGAPFRENSGRNPGGPASRPQAPPTNGSRLRKLFSYPLLPLSFAEDQLVVMNMICDYVDNPGRAIVLPEVVATICGDGGGGADPMVVELQSGGGGRRWSR